MPLSFCLLPLAIADTRSLPALPSLEAEAGTPETIFLSSIHHQPSQPVNSINQFNSINRINLTRLLLEHLRQHGHHLEKVPHDTVVGFTEDRGILVSVDCDDDLGGFHARKMLDRPGKPAAYV